MTLSKNINNLIFNDENFISFIIQSTKNTFEKNSNILFENGYRSIKYIKLENIIYIFEKTKDKFKVFEKHIRYFEKDQDIYNYLYYFKKDFEENKELYLNKVLDINLNYVDRDSISQILTNSGNFKNVDLNLILDCIPNQIDFYNINSLYQYTSFLNKLTFNNDFDLHYFLKKNNLSLNYINNIKEDFLIKSKSLYLLSKNNKYTLANKYDFNDYDNFFYANYDYFNYLNKYDLNFTCYSLTRDNQLTIEYPVDILSYDYQMKYFCFKFNKNELDFLIQSVFTLGGGFDYDKEKGSFYDSSITYDSNVINFKPNLLNNVTSINAVNYLYLKKFSYLNKDWKESLKKLNTFLKEHKPEAIVFEKDTLEETYQYIFKKLDKI